MNMPALMLSQENAAGWCNGWASLASSLPEVPPNRSPRPEPALQGPADRESSAADDLAWIGLVQRGDEDAARALVQRLYPTVIKLVRCHLPRRTSEEDMVQAVFAKVFNKLRQFTGRGRLEHWVARITINLCLNQIQHEAVRPELRMGDLREEEEAVVQRLACTQDDLTVEQNKAAAELLEKLLATLKPDQRLVITLLHLEERSTKEVSQMTGWSVPLVKVKAFRARQKMRKHWQTILKRQRE